jgi:hypothetical protein
VGKRLASRSHLRRVFAGSALLTSILFIYALEIDRIILAGILLI